MDKLDKSGTLPEVAAKLGIGAYHRHVFLCTGDKCCTAEVGAAAWDVLKRELKDRGLSLSTGPNACYRTKVNCLRICQGGPIAVVYPEGTWYSGLTAERIPLFVRQHLVEGRPVAEWVFADNPLPNPADEPPKTPGPG
jgi:(2Fe-2S) ferredoxin